MGGVAGGDVNTSHSSWRLFGRSRQSSTAGATQISPSATAPVAAAGVGRARPAPGCLRRAHRDLPRQASRIVAMMTTKPAVAMWVWTW